MNGGAQENYSTDDGAGTPFRTEAWGQEKRTHWSHERLSCVCHGPEAGSKRLLWRNSCHLPPPAAGGLSSQGHARRGPAGHSESGRALRLCQGEHRTTAARLGSSARFSVLSRCIVMICVLVFTFKKCTIPTNTFKKEKIEGGGEGQEQQVFSAVSSLPLVTAVRLRVKFLSELRWVRGQGHRQRIAFWSLLIAFWSLLNRQTRFRIHSLL